MVEKLLVAVSSQEITSGLAWVNKITDPDIKQALIKLFMNWKKGGPIKDYGPILELLQKQLTEVQEEANDYVLQLGKIREELRGAQQKAASVDDLNHQITSLTAQLQQAQKSAVAVDQLVKDQEALRLEWEKLSNERVQLTAEQQQLETAQADFEASKIGFEQDIASRIQSELEQKHQAALTSLEEAHQKTITLIKQEQQKTLDDLGEIILRYQQTYGPQGSGSSDPDSSSSPISDLGSVNPSANSGPPSSSLSATLDTAVNQIWGRIFGFKNKQ